MVNYQRKRDSGYGTTLTEMIVAVHVSSDHSSCMQTISSSFSPAFFMVEYIPVVKV